MVFGFVEMNIYVVLSILTAFLIFNLALVIFLGNTKRTYARAFAFGSILTALWAFIVGIDLGVTHMDTPFSLFFFSNKEKVTYYLGLLIVFSFFYFCFNFPRKRPFSQKIFWSFVIFAILVFPVFFFTDLIIDKSGPIPNELYTYKTGSLSLFYTILFFGLAALGFFDIFKKARSEHDPYVKKNLTLMSWTLVVGYIPPLIFGIILPHLEVITYFYIFLSIISNSIWTFFVAYTIIKYNQMDVRFVTTELLVILAIFLLFIAIFI